MIPGCCVPVAQYAVDESFFMSINSNSSPQPSVLNRSEAVNVMQVNKETALKASHIGHGIGIPGLDALILSSLLVPDCTEIYTTDSHLELY